MKSIFITLLMFMIALAATHWGLFELMSSKYTIIIASILLILAFILALKVLGNPFSEDIKDDKDN